MVQHVVVCSTGAEPFWHGRPEYDSRSPAEQLRPLRLSPVSARRALPARIPGRVLQPYQYAALRESERDRNFGDLWHYFQHTRRLWQPPGADGLAPEVLTR